MSKREAYVRRELGWGAANKVIVEGYEVLGADGRLIADPSNRSDADWWLSSSDKTSPENAPHRIVELHKRTSGRSK